MKAKQILFMGTGKVGRECLNILRNVSGSAKLKCLAAEAEQIPTMEPMCKKLEIPYMRLSSETIKDYLLSQKDETLIISAHNDYLFPKEIVERPNIKIINFHNAYLPDFRGRNAPTWEIYEGAVYGGATWHEVDASIDTGGIIVQEKVPIGKDETALSLLMKSAEAGIKLLRKNVDIFLSGEYRVNYPKRKGKLYHSKELPNEGFLNPEWDIKKAYNFLRSMDYNPLNIMPLPKVRLGEKMYEISGYALRDENIPGGGAERLQNQGSGLTDGNFVRPTGNALKLVKDISEIKEAITKVKESSEEWHTNFYLSDSLLKRWITFEQVYLVNFFDGFCIIRDRGSFAHLYFYVNDIESLRSELLLLKQQLAVPIVSDLIASAEFVKSTFTRSGFAKYCALTRMIKRNMPINRLKPTDQYFANEDEAEDILSIIKENMDPLCEQIPDLSEIKIAVHSRNILVCRDSENIILALLYFERYEKTAYLRYWVTSKNSQGLGYGKMLYRLYESINADVVLFKLWVRYDNIKVKRIYENYGYIYDKLKDEVFVLGVRTINV